jgi:hypothetical protein
MKSIVFAILLASLILPSQLSWAQNVKPSDTLTVEVLTPYSYKSKDGSTVVLGEVQNKNNFPVTGVKLGVSFYDGTGKIIEYKTGTTLLKVIPAGGKAPFSIISKQDPSITEISVNLTGFNSSPGIQQVLVITPGTLEISDQLVISGTILNTGTILTSGTTMHMISYDPFGRVVGISSSASQPADIGVGKTSIFTISSTPNSITKSYRLVAESDNYQSSLTDITDVKTTLRSATELVTINDVSVTDLIGNKYSSIPVGNPAKITSEIWIKYASENSEQPYIAYVQIKQIGTESTEIQDDTAIVEFIGTIPGVFHGMEKQEISVNWVPERPGAFYVEVYVWDPDAVALAEPSRHINVMLVK